MMNGGPNQSTGSVEDYAEDEPFLESSPPSERSSRIDRANAERSKSSLYLILLTISIGGLQVAWSVELSSISPFLLSLGLSKSLLALVWIAGPLGGTLVQPYVGMLSDNCRVKWGRRRPFIVVGAITTMVSLLALAWTREVVAGFAKVFGGDPTTKSAAVARQVFAVVWVYILDFVINIIQAAIRALIVDCAPTHQQEDANAWANRITGIGNIVGYLAGYMDLPKVAGWLGNSQFKGLVTITCMLMSATVIINCVAIKEQDPHVFGSPTPGGNGLVAFFRSLYRSVRRLPVQIRNVCLVQICAWIGWFPFLFYITTYVGGIYADPYFAKDPNLSHDQIEKIWAEGTRVGTFALFIFAITTFIASMVIPLMVVPTYKPASELRKSAHSNGMSPVPSSEETGSSMPEGPIRPRIFRSLSSRPSPLDSLQIPHLTLRRAWLFSHICFAVLMWLTLFVTNTVTATALVALVGIPWAVTNWAPFALIAGEISRRDAERRGLRAPLTVEGDGFGSFGAHDSIDEESGTGSHHALHTNTADPSTDQAGVILGIHNVSIAAPQVIATVVSSAIFKVLQRPRGVAGDDSVGWVLRFGGCCAIAAAYWCRRLGDPAG